MTDQILDSFDIQWNPVNSNQITIPLGSYLHV